MSEQDITNVEYTNVTTQEVTLESCVHKNHETETLV